jgi:hypothetical protein
MTAHAPDLPTLIPASTIPQMAGQPLRARVRNGRLVLDEPTDLPEGTEIALVPADSWDDLPDDDRQRLHEALASSQEDCQHGRLRPVDDVFDELPPADR